MKRTNSINTKKGFTLIEVLVVLTIMGMVTTMIFSLLFFGFNVFNMTSDEYELQTNVRLAMQKTDSLVRYSSALFAVPDMQYKDAEWNYIGVSDDHTRIVSYTWDSTTNTHLETTMAGPFSGITFSMGFSKANRLSTDNTLELYFESHGTDGSSRRFNIQSGYEALNALQVVDYGTDLRPATALAYRNGTSTYENYNLIVNIAMVLDTSGSMDWDLNGNTIKSGSSTLSRIDILQQQASALIDMFAENQNSDVDINISLVPFGSYAKTPSNFYNVKNSSEKSQLKNVLNNLSANGSTNTGDGLRRAYDMLNSKSRTDMASAGADTIVKNYTIILVDGVTNTHSMANSSSTSTSIGCVKWNSRGVCTKTGNVTTTTWQQGFYTGTETVGNCTFTPTATSCTPGYVWGNDGNSTSNDYVNLMGARLSDPDFVSNYLVSFAMSKTTSQISFIAAATATPEERIYYATSADTLGLSFTEIQMSINNELWRFLGPKLADNAE